MNEIVIRVTCKNNYIQLERLFNHNNKNCVQEWWIHARVESTSQNKQPVCLSYPWPGFKSTNWNLKWVTSTICWICGFESKKYTIQLVWDYHFHVIWASDTGTPWELRGVIRSVHEIQGVVHVALRIHFKVNNNYIFWVCVGTYFCFEGNVARKQSFLPRRQERRVTAARALTVLKCCCFPLKHSSDRLLVRFLDIVLLLALEISKSVKEEVT